MEPQRREVCLISLVTSRQDLEIRCIDCGREKRYPPLEAIATFGANITFAELRMIIEKRCGAEPCKALIGPTSKPRPKGWRN
jgi:hypothetical protein